MPEDGKNDRNNQNPEEGAGRSKEDEKNKEKNTESSRKQQDNGENEALKVSDNVDATGFVKDVEMEEKKKKEMRREIDDERPREFTRTCIIKPIEYTFGDLDIYLHNEYKDVHPIYRYTIEVIIIAVLFTFFPILAVLLDKRSDISSIKSILFPESNSELSNYMKNSIFVTITYAICMISDVAVGNLLYIIANVLHILDVRIESTIATILQIIGNSTKHLRNSLAAILIFFLAENLYGDYVFFKKEIDAYHLIMTLLVWYSFFSLMLFVENIFINVIVEEVGGRGRIGGRIFDTNYKTFVFKKLAAVAQMKPYGKREMRQVIVSMTNDFESSIYLRHNDLDLTSSEAASNTVKSIFAYLDTNSLKFEDIQEFFPSNYEEVYTYLSKGENIDKHAQIPFEVVHEQAQVLYQERRDIMHTLIDRDTILGKLNIVLIGFVAFLGMVLLFFLLNVDYKIYLASIGPFLFTFGWIFQGSVVEIYRCFVFLLFSHPFDSGDRVVIDNEELVVTNIDLLYTTVKNSHGLKTYIPNVVLFTKNIGNVRRSDIESEEITLMVDGNTNFTQILSMKEKLQNSLKDSEKDFTGDVIIKNYEMENGKIKVVLSVQHTSSSHNLSVKYSSRESFIRKLEEVLRQSKINYTHRYKIKT
eukprot:jgi/Antlo1/2496/1690